MTLAEPCIRRLAQSDSIEALTELIHRAYAPLGARGLNFTAVDQSTEVTRERIGWGTCFVATLGSDLVGTIVVRATHTNSVCPDFNKPGVATVHQFAVAPELQGAGIGSALLSAAEAWARESGFAELLLDTAQPVTELIEYYKRHGYNQVTTVQWPGKTYRSVVMGKAVSGQ
ncbi:MAG: GNAT family N-acetyltransferase [candidate division Zixibacteria bacterium]|nr:GNAT family N-acetyltransferase [candidate division Zixibacteria bacterium]